MATHAADQTIGQRKYCVGCVTSLHVSARACPHCGAHQSGGTIGTKSRVTAILLAFFLGGFGAHKFYLGRPGAGIIYLIFFWTFIPALIAFVEFIVYICMSDEAFTAKYG